MSVKGRHKELQNGFPEKWKEILAAKLKEDMENTSPGLENTHFFKDEKNKKKPHDSKKKIPAVSVSKKISKLPALKPRTKERTSKKSTLYRTEKLPGNQSSDDWSYHVFLFFCFSSSIRLSLSAVTLKSNQSQTSCLFVYLYLFLPPLSSLSLGT